jgi:acyl-CoA reductase-like NAD-dependent aldehyde dehydrogenase
MNSAPIPALGGAWPQASLLWGQRTGSGDGHALRSPVGGSLIQQTQFLDARELGLLLEPQPALRPIARDELALYAARLHAALAQLREPLREAMRLETAFVWDDCDELLDGSLEFVHGFPAALADCERALPAALHYAIPGQTRRLRLERCAWGTVVVILPQNAFLLVAVTALLNGLAAGNRVILRAPQQSARSAALLGTVLEMAPPPQNAASVVLARAKEFVEAVYQSSAPCLLHYMGSSDHAPAIVEAAFRHGKAAIADGAGNVWVYVDADADPDLAAAWLTSGATRYNGQTCTSVNGALIHPALYDAVRSRLVEKWNRLHAGDPATAPIGPLFDAKQAAWCQSQLETSGATLLCGGGREENLLQPALVENPAPDSALVAEGLFGPALWMAPGDAAVFTALWPRNRYPLCAGVISPTADPTAWLAQLPNLARLVVNGDPSVEHIYEPWGGYPASGANPVGVWLEKYQRVVSVDEAA